MSLAGLTGTAVCTRPYEVSTNNTVGGTADMPTGEYRVRIVRSFYDYEVGVRCIAVLTSDADRAAEAARRGDGRCDYVYFTERSFRPD